MSDEQFEALLVEIRNISHGGQSGPLGLEAITMALCGKDGVGDQNVSSGLYAIAESINLLAGAIEDATRKKHSS